MRLPLVLVSDLDPAVAPRWRAQFVALGRDTLEGLWVRTQDQRNQHLSGWRDEQDRRRKLLHYIDRYALVPDAERPGRWALVLAAPYLWLQLAAPTLEIDALHEQLRQAARDGGFRAGGGTEELRRGDLRLGLRQLPEHGEDARRGRRFPVGYRLLELTLRGATVAVEAAAVAHPWQVLDLDIRPREEAAPGQPVRDLRQLLRHLPAQVELGCGPSIEAGIPPLHHLHHVYGIADSATRRFLFAADSGGVLGELLRAPEAFYRRSTEIYGRALQARPTAFYQMLRREIARGRLLGPVLTNNFDGLPAVLGLPEQYLRTYEDLHRTPDLRFHDRARSLLVVGSHADRRRTRRAARAQGLQVIYVDPQGYRDGDRWVDYPLESVYPEDLLVPMSAAEFAQRWQDVAG